MSSLLTLDQISAATPDGRALFSNLTLSIGAERVGLVGRNGAGKSTLLSIVAGERDPASGTVVRSGRIGRLRQLPDVDGSVADAIGLAPALAVLARLERGEGDAEDAAAADWGLPERLSKALADVGLPQLDPRRPAASLSGGERTRLALAAVLLEEPDLLVLDEPTNNMDAAGREAVARLIAHWRGGVLVASHDRSLLEAVDRIVELTATGVTVFSGGWSAFEAARDAAREQAASDLDRARRDLARQSRGVQETAERKARRDRMGRRKRARGDEPKILLDARADRAERTDARNSQLGEKLVGAAQDAVERARERVEILAPLAIDLPDVRVPAGRTLVAFHEVELRRADRKLFGPLSFTIEGPQRCAIAGPNGAGKTSLIRLITGELEPDSGTVERSPHPAAFLDQSLTILDGADTLLDLMMARHPEMTANDAYAALARYAFRNADARRSPATLSGGERIRAGLAIAMSAPEPPQLLILDEPTNHLDIASTEILEDALAGFSGALLIVSHDAAFLQAVGVAHVVDLAAEGDQPRVRRM
ncbi:MAG: ABC-F family ATP-binding cassette domain-containing protein [Hyphomonadaceae bacterium]